MGTTERGDGIYSRTSFSKLPMMKRRHVKVNATVDIEPFNKLDKIIKILASFAPWELRALT